MDDHNVIPIRAVARGREVDTWRSCRAALLLASEIADDIERLRGQRGNAPMSDVERDLCVAFRQAVEVWERLRGKSIADEGCVMEWLAV